MEIQNNDKYKDDIKARNELANEINALIKALGAGIGQNGGVNPQKRKNALSGQKKGLSMDKLELMKKVERLQELIEIAKQSPKGEMEHDDFVEFNALIDELKPYQSQILESSRQILNQRSQKTTPESK